MFLYVGFIAPYLEVVLPKLTIQQENGQELSFEDNSFDRYVSNMCVMLAPDPDKFLRECRRGKE